MTHSFDLIVIGAGPGGYVAAIRAAQLGLSVACIDKREVPGGTCLHVGCIPSKALLHSTEFYARFQHEAASLGVYAKELSYSLKTMMDRKTQIITSFQQGIESLFKKYRITFFKGAAKLISPQEVEVQHQKLWGQHILIATGSEPIALPFLPFDEKRIVSSTGALSLSEVPKKMVVVGAGVIGVELGSVYCRLGSEVVFLEAADRVCASFDPAISKELQKILEGQGLQFRLSNSIVSADINPSQVRVYTKEGIYEADIVLVAVGRRPYTQGLGLESVGLVTTHRGNLPVNGRFQTAVPSIYAIGDVIDGPMLAHKASEEGVVFAEMLAGQKPALSYLSIPNVVYTTPEVASVGLTEDEARKYSMTCKTGQFPFKVNSRAKCTAEEQGFVKMVSDAVTDRLLGVHIIGPHASELIAEACVAIQNGLTTLQFAHTPHAHPTLSEALKEAALALHGRAIHR